jgi:hypothetical protein
LFTGDKQTLKSRRLPMCSANSVQKKLRKACSVRICVTYRQDHCVFLPSLSEQISGCPEIIIVMRDFNFHMMQQIQKSNRILLPLKQHLVYGQTHKDGHKLDLVIRFSDDIVTNMDLSPPMISVHSFVN